jgi:hypothetical protein
VTVTGPLFVGNALEVDVEVAVLRANMSSEVKWKVPAKAPFPSVLIRFADVEFFRFRLLLPGNGKQSWSDPVYPQELKKPKNHSLSIPCKRCEIIIQISVVICKPANPSILSCYFRTVFEEKEGGMLVVHRVWCTLVEESMGDGGGETRSLVVLSPFFRIRSFLPTKKTGRISTSQQILSAEHTEQFTLLGKGQQIQIQFTGNHEETHHLHFSSK